MASTAHVHAVRNLLLGSLRRSLVEASWGALGPREWKRMDVASSGSTRSVTVVQFNVLAHGLSCEASGFGGFDQVAPQWLDFEQRKKRLLEDLLRVDGADFICLEEVDHFDDWCVIRHLRSRALRMPGPLPCPLFVA